MACFFFLVCLIRFPSSHDMNENRGMSESRIDFYFILTFSCLPWLTKFGLACVCLMKPFKGVYPTPAVVYHVSTTFPISHFAPILVLMQM
ncbi:hypothetical protein B0I35DRAFT_213236 [Stachybotrys elegans]|uniref:Uncharacterized protein n=1 Tax=Stachybotrys elegans TaxID=80388 RepID=A0A8K0SZ07_9HYPO|nr:hypothetical protein B0I35DRAFT_213236 [Stachybotrys elegans]